MAKSFYLANAIINHALRAGQGPAFVRPATIYLALYTTPPTQAGGGVEVSGGSYARRPIVFTDPENGISTNSSDVSFPTATDVWGMSRDFGVFDSLSGGNLLYLGPLAEPRTVILGATLVFLAGQLALVET